MREYKPFQEVYTNQCYRNGPCLNGTPVEVSREQMWDYYDKASKSYIYLECRLNQKHYTPSLLQIEEADKFQSGLSTETYETPDLQLHDTNGKWFTRSDDPEMYRWPANFDEKKTCNICDLVCDIRDMQQYMREDGSCPFDDPAPEPVYSKVADYDRPCQDFLHPLLLQDLKAINRRKARTTKAYIWKYLKEPKWMHTLINSGQRMIDVWRRNYQPVTFYYSSLESIALYIKNMPPEMKKTYGLLKRIRENLEYSPSFKECLARGEWEGKMLANIDGYVEEAEKRE